jgi:glycogen operon protein
MVLMGDECGRSQDGNNNAYCQDNAISWLDWSLVTSDDGKSLHAFVARLIELRRQYETLRFGKFMGDEEVLPGVAQLSWWDERGVQLSPEDWDNRQGRILIMRRALRKEDGTVEITALMMNASGEKINFKLPGEFPWQLMFDTSDPAIQPRALEAHTYDVLDRAAALLVAEIGP